METSVISFKKNIIVVFALTILAKLAAFLTELTVANYLGTSSLADAYNIVFSVHYIIYPMVGVGLWKAFMPEYNKVLVVDGIKSANELANIVLNFTVVIGVLITAFVMLFSTQIVTLVAPGFDVATQKICANLVFISGPQYLFVLLAAFYSALLQSHNKFFASNLKEVVTYIPIIIAGYFFYEIFGINTLAYGILLGGLFRWLLQVPFIDWGLKPYVNFRVNTNLINIATKIPLLLVTTAIYDFNIFVTKSIATTAGIGSVASLSYGERISNVIVGLTAGVLSIVLFPKLSKIAGSRNFKELNVLIKNYCLILIVLLVPMTLIGYYFSFNIVSITFQRGAFNALSTFSTAKVFEVYILGIIFVGLKAIYNNLYYAVGNIRLPFIASLVAIISNIIMSIIFSKYYGIVGLAAANIIANIIESFLLFLYLNRYIPIVYCQWGIEILKILVAGFVMIIFVEFSKSVFCINNINFIAISLGALLVYIILLKIFAVDSFMMLIKGILKR